MEALNNIEKITLVLSVSIVALIHLSILIIAAKNKQKDSEIINC